MLSRKKNDRLATVKPLSAPLNVCLSVTGKCNLRCLHCYTKDSWQAAGLSSDAMVRLIDQMGRARVLDVLLFGGEPLMRRDVFSIIAHLKRYPISISMSTNATLVTREMGRKLYGAGVRSFVVSVDGMRHGHDAMRGKGTFSRTISGIRALLAAGATVVISFTVSRLNIRDIERVAALGRKMGVSMVKFNRLNYIGNAADNFESLYVSPAEELAICKRVIALSEQYPGFVGGTYKLLHGQLREPVKSDGGRIIVPVCGAGVDRCAIRPDGGIVPCEVVWDVPDAAKVTERSFIAQWRSSRIMNEFRKPLRVDFDNNEKCLDCAKIGACFWGRCVPYYYGGAYRSRSLFCYEEHADE